MTGVISKVSYKSIVPPCSVSEPSCDDGPWLPKVKESAFEDDLGKSAKSS